MAGPVGLQKLSDIGDEGIVGIGIGEEGADAEQDLGDGEGGGPLVLEDVEADAAVGVDVAVVDAGGEVDLGGFEGVVGGEVDVEEEDPAGVRRVVGPHDGGLPVEHVIADGTGRAVCRRVLAQIDQFLIDSLQRHGCWYLFIEYTIYNILMLDSTLWAQYSPPIYIRDIFRKEIKIGLCVR